jgi:hypothetical protein
MPVISYNLPDGALRKMGTRDRFVAWLEEHVGAASDNGVLYTLNACDRTTFIQVLKEYETVIGTDWQYRKHINRMLIVRAENWSLWQVSAQTRSINGHFLSYQYAVFIADETLAVQFKLSCL